MSTGRRWLWNEVQIIFNGAPFQIQSDADIPGLVASGAISLQPTNEVYICAVVGHKPIKK